MIPGDLGLKVCQVAYLANVPSGKCAIWQMRPARTADKLR